MCAVTMTVFSSCREGYTVPFYVGCSPNLEPFCYIDGNGQLTGIEIDIINAIGEDQGVKFDFIQSDQPGIFDELLTRWRKMDCGIAMIEWTTDREDYYTFVNPGYFTSSLALATAKGSGITSLADMSGKIMAVRNWSLAEGYVEELADLYGFTVKTYETCDEVIKAVENGQADACEEHLELIRYRIDKRGAALQIADPGVKNISFAVITEKDEDKTLRGYLFNGLANLIVDKKLDKIIGRYIQE